MSLHPSLWRPITIFGVEILTAVAECVAACAITVMGGVHPLAILAGVAFAALLHGAALAGARSDPFLPWAYLRSLRHPDYFPARPWPGVRSRSAVVSVPRS